MTYVLVDSSGAVLKYPARQCDLITAYPQTSFPHVLSDEALASFGLHRVLPADPPVHDAFAQQASEAAPVCVDGVWIQQWSIQDLPEDALVHRCDYQAFWDALLISPVYQVIRAKAISDLNANTCCTEFIAAMGDAKAGRPNRNALQACIWLLMAALTLSPEQVQALQELLAIGHLDRLYSLTPPA